MWRAAFLFWALLLAAGIARARLDEIPVENKIAIDEKAVSDGQLDIVKPEVVTEWRKFDGVKVTAIEIEGLKRSRRQAILWLMRTHIGKAFKADDLLKDLQVLYNTGNLYDLDGILKDTPEGLVVTIRLRDKWTLFPAFGAQGGGGSNTFGAGIFESNLLGYMVNASFFTWQFNGANSYDLNFNQEYFAGSTSMWSLDLQDSIEAQTPKLYNGQSAGNFAWRRQQKEIMLGDHFESNFRLLLYASVFQDSTFNNDGNFHVNTLAGLQNKLYPKLIYGKVNWSNYQEHGYELTLQPSFANVVGPAPFYSSIELDYKQVWVTGYKERDNFAMYFSGSSLSPGGPNYQLQVGGYYNVRGFADMREVGHSLAFANFEYRPYLFKYRWDLFDLDLMVVQGCFFSDVGSAWADASLTGDAQAEQFHALWSAGAGLRINMVKFAGAILRLDWAQTLSPYEGWGFSFGIGQFF